jgi:glycosyltransferase involved in cell wall biosynthesis
MKKAQSPAILYVSTFPPRECGIATFTEDLTNAIDKEFSPELKSRILAMNNTSTALYNYPSKTTMQITDSDMEDYLEVAKKINNDPLIKLVNIQHEYGIYGGDWGTFLLPFMELVKKPIVLTMHTVLPNPEDWDEREKLIKVTQKIAEKANAIIVMTASAAKLLVEIYGVPAEKINVIPHGVHHIAFPSKSKAKAKLNLEGRTVFSTFGMLNRDKGIEYAIQALPQVVKKYPDVVYLVLGATHPVVRREEGEVYRTKLEKLVEKLNLQDHVKFYDKYLSLDELIEFLKATDIYISPTLNPLQAVSGTISYALSCACPIVATANQYAKDVINEERGRLVDFRNATEIKRALLELMKKKKLRKEMKTNTYFYSRHMTWQNVALSYFKVFNQFAKLKPREAGKLPVINLDHINALTDKFGMIQFATHTKPDMNSGYCIDDNARALLALAKHYNNTDDRTLLPLIEKYFKFVKFTQKPSGKFYNFVNKHRKFIDKMESEDSFGRAIWALGYVAADAKLPAKIVEDACKALAKAKRWMTTLESSRANAFALLGLYYAQNNWCDVDGLSRAEILKIMKQIADKLVRRYNEQIKLEDGTEWHWFEDSLTYSNYKLPEALLRVYQATGNKKYLAVAEESLQFLAKVNFEDDFFSAIGQDGWYFRDGKRSYFDQQPEDAASATEGLMTAFEVTGDDEYMNKAKLAFEWFLGKNHLSQMLYDEATGGCYDGLGRESINFNQGAESTLSYLLARLALEDKRTEDDE